MSSASQCLRSTLVRLSVFAFALGGMIATAQVTRLSFRPVDAAYSRSIDRLIFAAANPNQLHIYNVANQSDQTVTLPDAPLNLSLSSDGLHAAVAFSNSVAYVNLQSASVEQTYSGIAVGTGKVLVGGGYIYIMPSYGGNPASINLSSGQVTQTQFFGYASGGVYDAAVNAIYSTEDGISPNSLNRYSIGAVLGNGASQPSAYFAVFSVCGPLSLSENGDTIFTGCGTVYRSSNDPAQDMRYLGVLPGIQGIQNAVHSGTRNQLAVIPKVPSYYPQTTGSEDTTVKLFDAHFFNLAGQFATTPFAVNSTSYPAHGRWVFYNSSESALLIVTQADSQAALTQDFAVENVDLSSPNSCSALFGATSAAIAATGSYATAPVLSGEDCVFTAVSNAPWITLSSGFMGSGNTALTYLVRPNLSSTPRSGTISLGSQVFTVNQDGQSTSSSALTALSFSPVAADYDKPLDKIVMVSAAPNELHIYDPVTQADQTVSLNSIPLSVSVRPDGLSAAVGHSGSISIVDLQAQSVTTIPVDMDNGGILLASNGYAYAFPSQTYSWGTINSVQISTGVLTGLSDTYDGNIPRLDASGNYLYVGGYGSSKLNISNGPASIVNSSFALPGNFWLSENGDRIITSNGSAFLTSPVSSLDLAPNGHLNGSNVVSWMANSQRLHQTAILSDVDSHANTQLQFYADDGLLLQNQVGLPSFSNAGVSYVSHGRYLFWNAAASKLFAIIQADKSSGLLSDFALYTLNATDSIPSCNYAVVPGAVTVPAVGYGSWYFDVTSNCTWAPAVPNTTNPWLYVSGSGGYVTGNGRVSFYAYTNTGAARSMSVTFGDKAAVITQTAASCTYSLSSTSRSFSQAGGTGEVNLLTDANCPWSIQGSVSWVSVSSGQSGTGPATVRYSVDANTTSVPARSAYLNIAGQSYSVQETTVPVSVPSNFVPMRPCRIADTREARGPFGAPSLAANSTRTFSLLSSNCNIPSSATAFSLNITVVPHGPLSYLTAWPSSQPQPFVSTLNSTDGRVKANAAIIDAGVSKAVSFYATDPTDLVVDITGYFVNANTGVGLAFYPLAPCRIADTRDANAPLRGPVIAEGETRDLPIQQSNCNLNPSAQAYSLNFTAIPEEDTLQYLTTWPSGQNKPLVSTLNAWTGSVTANAAILQAGSGGDINVYVTEDTHVVLDTNGYFAPPAADGLYFYSVAPCRVLDTRNTGNGLPFKGVLSVPVSGACNIPSNASAVVMNSTVVPSQTLDYLTLWPSGGSRPVVSTLNAYDGATSSNMAITPLAGGSLDAFATDNTHLILDVTGYFAP